MRESRRNKAQDAEARRRAEALEDINRKAARAVVRDEEEQREAPEEYEALEELEPPPDVDADLPNAETGVSRRDAPAQ
ncbi:MAG TPA: hypothetical protein VFQ38_10095 [Longimicrobiales bacterium]|nr:hypothetical protein [Longimicrobiales bacterium]